MLKEKCQTLYSVSNISCISYICSRRRCRCCCCRCCYYYCSKQCGRKRRKKLCLMDTARMKKKKIVWRLFVKVDVKGRDTEAFEMNWVRSEKVFFFWIRNVVFFSVSFTCWACISVSIRAIVWIVCIYRRCVWW